MSAYDKTSIQINRCKRILALVDDYMEKQDAATRTDLRKALMEEFEAPSIAPPVAAGSVDSIETNEFCDLMTEIQDMNERLGNCKPNWDALIAHIHSWGEQQREAGRAEQTAFLKECMDRGQAEFNRKWTEQKERADKAEAELDTLRESLRLVNVDHGLWMARTHVAEDARDDALTRVKDLEAERQALQTEGKHPAPCARHCEANAYQIEVRRLVAVELDMHRKLAAEVLRADQGWARYEAANRAKNAAEATFAAR